ncbi:MAG: glycosyltransferase family 4 protein [Crocinitomicaceae bacterium]
MRIALLTNFIPPYRKSLYESLDKKVDDLTIFISQEMENNRSWKANNSGLTVILQKGFRYNKTWKTGQGYSDKTTVQIPYDTFFQLRKQQPNLVISAELGFRSLLAMLYCKIYKKPLIIWLALSERTESNKKGMRKLLRKMILKRADALLTNGKSCERYLQSFHVQKPMFYVPYTSDFIKTATKTVEQGPKTILMTGQLIERKGIDQTAKAIYTWAKENNEIEIILLIAGDGPEKSKFERIAKLPNINLQLIGNVAYEKMQELYARSDIYLFPTLGDEWGVVVNEAMIFALPIIGSKYSQAVEELVDENGWIFDPDNHSDFVKILTEAIETPREKLKKMGVCSAKNIEKYTPNRISDTILEAINIALKN